MSCTEPGPRRSDTIDLARAFRFVPEDPDWIKKVLIGGVFMLLTPPGGRAPSSWPATACA